MSLGGYGLHIYSLIVPGPDSRLYRPSRIPYRYVRIDGTYHVIVVYYSGRRYKDHLEIHMKTKRYLYSRTEWRQGLPR